MSTGNADLKRYVICREDCSLAFIEALAMMGLVKNSRVEKCGKKNFYMIIIELYTGDIVRSSCRFVEEVQQSLRIVKVYSAINARNKAYDKISVVDAKEVFFDK